MGRLQRVDPTPPFSKPPSHPEDGFLRCYCPPNNCPNVRITFIIAAVKSDPFHETAAGDGDGLEVEVGVGLGVELGFGDGVGEDVREGVGVGVDEYVGLGRKDGVGVGVGMTETVGKELTDDEGVGYGVVDGVIEYPCVCEPLFETLLSGDTIGLGLGLGLAIGPAVMVTGMLLDHGLLNEPTFNE